MHIGLMMECDYRAGKTQEEAFHEAFSTAAHAEEWGFDGVWLAERHFAPPESGRRGTKRTKHCCGSKCVHALACAGRR